MFEAAGSKLKWIPKLESGMVLAEELAEYVSSVRYANIPEAVVSEAQKRVIDSIGCAIGAFNAEPVRIARGVVGKMRTGGQSTLLGTRMRSSPELATFVNCIMVRYLDYNDTYLSKEPAHPSDNIPACLAVAEAEGASGREFLLSVILAYEIQCRLCDAGSLRHRGWDHVNYGLVSTALAAGKLMDLPVRKMKQAVNISLSGHTALRQVRAGELSMWKGASFANAARNGVFSALLARGGMTGPSPVFEGEMGFFKQVSGPLTVDTQLFGGRRGSFKLTETYIKYFPAEYHSQSAIWAALELRRQVERVEDIVSVLVETHEAGYTILAKDHEKWSPQSRETADHSLPYIVGMALLEGRVGASTFTPGKFRHPRVLEFLKRITVREDPDLTAMYPGSIANRVTVKLSSGEVLSKQVNDPRGHPKNPMTDEEIEAKFRTLTGRHFSKGQAARLLKRVWGLQSQRDVSGLVEDCLVGLRAKS